MLSVLMLFVVKISRWEELPAGKQKKTKPSQSTNFLHQFPALKYTREVSPDHPSIRGTSPARGGATRHSLASPTITHIGERR